MLLAAVACVTAPGFAQNEGATPTAGVRVVVKNQGFLPFADAPINYRSQDLNDPIAKLQKRLDGGKTVLRFDAQHGYLQSVLDALRVPVSSQALVFSKTKFEGAAEQLVRYLLFTNETPLERPVAGTSGFTEEFAARVRVMRAGVRSAISIFVREFLDTPAAISSTRRISTRYRNRRKAAFTAGCLMS